MQRFTYFLSCLAVASGLALSTRATAQNAGFQVKDMDRTVKPGTDFYRYANGGWMQAHPLTPEYARFGAFDQLAENNRNELRTLIEGLAATTSDKGTLQQKIGDLYRLAMDSTRRNAQGNTPLQADIARIAAAPTVQALQVLTAKLARKGVPSYFHVYADADLKASKENLVSLHQGGLSLGEREYYLDNDSATRKVREAFKAYVVKMFALAGFDQTTAQANMEHVLRIETQIAQAARTATQLRDVEGNYHKISYAQLLTDYPGIDWGTLFLTLGYPAFEDINVGQPEAIHAVERLLKEEPLSALKAYATFHLIDAAAAYLSDDFSQASFDFYGRTLSGRQAQQPRWKRAVSIVDNVLGMAVGKMYVDKYFPPAAKERMLALVKNLQVALGQRIDAQTWMDAATKEKAHEKLNAFYVKIGYPNKWRDYTGLQIDPTRSFWENLTNASVFEADYTIAQKVNKPVDRDEWLMTPQTVNAYYNPTTNEICFPAGILQPPFFDMQANDAVNYGAIGVVIGHEMTHGFDDQGRQFDKDGNLTDWWSKADGERFEAKSKVMVHFFDKIQVLPGLHANGSLTLGENLADHGGLKVAFQAFENATAQHPVPAVEGFTPAQQFFLAYAHVWAQNIRDEQIRVYTKSDPHALGEWRVNGALPHIGAWYKAFNIKKSDPLYVPKNKRVDIW